MKNIAIIIAIVALTAVYFIARDPMPNEVYFSGNTLIMGETSGWQGFAKTYQFNATGKPSFNDDYLQVITVKNTRDNIAEDSAGKVRDFIARTYSLEDFDDGQFGKFVPSGGTRDYYAYCIEKSTREATYFVMYIIQSNFDDNKLSLHEAKAKSDESFRQLKNVFDQITG